MPESASSFSKFGLSKIETHQVERRTSSFEDEKARVDFFAEHENLREAYVKRPFIQLNQESIAEIPHANNPYAVLRSAIMAEPPAAYETAFEQLPRSEQREKLYEQIDSSAEITVRIQEYIEANLAELESVPKEELYRMLCRVAFGTDDEKEIQARYALSQRRGFRLSIAHFLQGRDELRQFDREIQEDPQEFAGKCLGKKFFGKVEIERLPIGFVIYLEEKDYALIDTLDGNPQSIDSEGKTIMSNPFFYPSFPQTLNRRFVVINKGSEQRGMASRESLREVRNHEIRHVLFGTFHAQQQELYLSDTDDAIKECRTAEDFRAYSRKLLNDFIEKGKDEIIAYFSHGCFMKSLQALRADQYGWHIENIERALERRADISNKELAELREAFLDDQIQLLFNVTRIIEVAKKMYTKPDSGLIQGMLVKLGIRSDDIGHQNNIAEALLRNTPGMKIHRLARYVGMTPEEVKAITPKNPAEEENK